MDAPDGGAREEAHTDYFHLPFAGLAIVFLARRIQPPLSLVDREVEFCVLTKYVFSYYIYIYILSFLCGTFYMKLKKKLKIDPRILTWGVQHVVRSLYEGCLFFVILHDAGISYEAVAQ